MFKLWITKAQITVVALVACGPLCTHASELDSARVRSKSADQQLETIELFEGVAKGSLSVELIAKDSTVGTVVITNTTDKPLSIQLPATFAGVPVLAQFGGPRNQGFGNQGFGNQGVGNQGVGGQAGGSQALGGGFQGGQGNMGPGQGNGAMLPVGMGPGNGVGLGNAPGMWGGAGPGRFGGRGGFFRVAPDKPGKIRVACVCLEHGKMDPNSRIRYTLVPLAEVSNDPAVAKVCQMLGQGALTQATAQAAAWHLANGLSWDQLAKKNRSESRYTGNVRMFQTEEIRQAMYVVDEVSRLGTKLTSQEVTSQVPPIESEEYRVESTPRYKR